jgi:hypothetical protein
LISSNSPSTIEKNSEVRDNALRHALAYVVELDFKITSVMTTLSLSYLRPIEEYQNLNQFPIPATFRDIGTSAIKNKIKIFYSIA